MTSTMPESIGAIKEPDQDTELAEAAEDADSDSEEDSDDDAFPFHLGGSAAGCMASDWQDQCLAEMAKTGKPIPGLPRGLRLRPSSQNSSAATPLPVTGKLPKAKDNRLRLPSKCEVWLMGLLCVIAVLVTVYFYCSRVILPAVPSFTEPWRPSCHQCRPEWWHDFWKWRLQGLHQLAPVGPVPEGLAPPPGMEWEWGNSANDTDWFGASAELVDSVVRNFADPGLGPVLQIGCGDSPIPELLLRAGFPESEHIDIAPQVIELMRLRYPSDRFPGLRFEVRDFLASPLVGGGAPPPVGRFSAVIDKAGIWDWLQDEKVVDSALPSLLKAVRAALVPPPAQGIYAVVTKQTPKELVQSLRKAGKIGASFAVEASQPIGDKGIAWAYVLSPI